MYADDEVDYISSCRDKINSYPEEIYYDKNSLCKKILRVLQNECLLTARNGHDQLPPDFYSEECEIMFDAMRVNDTEIEVENKKKKILLNSKFKREKNIYKELEELEIFNMEKCTIFCNSEYIDYCEHSIDNFFKQAQRVVEKHIKKIKIWKKELPNIKYKGLFIFDESSVYFKGVCVPVDNTTWFFLYEGELPSVYFPWLDKNIMQQVYDSEIDFIVWYSPYKKNSFARQAGITYPSVVILDTRYPQNLVDYVYDEYELS